MLLYGFWTRRYLFLSLWKEEQLLCCCFAQGVDSAFKGQCLSRFTAMCPFTWVPTNYCCSVNLKVTALNYQIGKHCLTCWSMYCLYFRACISQGEISAFLVSCFDQVTSAAVPWALLRGACPRAGLGLACRGTLPFYFFSIICNDEARFWLEKSQC